MSTHSTYPRAGIDEPIAASRHPPAGVLVLFESTPGGVAALREAAAAGDADTQLTVVALAPQMVAPRCCARGRVSRSSTASSATRPSAIWSRHARSSATRPTG